MPRSFKLSLFGTSKTLFEYITNLIMKAVSDPSFREKRVWVRNPRFTVAHSLMTQDVCRTRITLVNLPYAWMICFADWLIGNLPIFLFYWHLIHGWPCHLFCLKYLRVLTIAWNYAYTYLTVLLPIKLELKLKSEKIYKLFCILVLVM